MAKSYTSRKNHSFSQKKQYAREMEELEESGLFDMLSNRQKLYSKKKTFNEEDGDFWKVRKML